jgi:hypothetical protein
VLNASDESQDVRDGSGARTRLLPWEPATMRVE